MLPNMDAKLWLFALPQFPNQILTSSKEPASGRALGYTQVFQVALSPTKCTSAPSSSSLFSSSPSPAASFLTKRKESGSFLTPLT
nr:hypothetical protein Iba_chr12aCG11380 [Ipomoea batatas]GMD66399.1 hypothetical protein Iba_chr12cCG14650 [Ipomoea batatas]GME05556.1 hypothetical protein Iba_scaffold3049CG0910 [Ipomoea batatas]